MLTYSERILGLFNSNADHGMGFSCADIIRQFQSQDSVLGINKVYKSDAISTALYRLVKKKVLKYSDNKTKRGGHIYVIRY